MATDYESMNPAVAQAKLLQEEKRRKQRKAKQTQQMSGKKGLFIEDSAGNANRYTGVPPAKRKAQPAPQKKVTPIQTKKQDPAKVSPALSKAVGRETSPKDYLSSVRKKADQEMANRKTKAQQTKVAETEAKRPVSDPKQLEADFQAAFAPGKKSPKKPASVATATPSGKRPSHHAPPVKPAKKGNQRNARPSKPGWKIPSMASTGKKGNQRRPGSSVKDTLGIQGGLTYNKKKPGTPKL